MSVGSELASSAESLKKSESLRDSERERLSQQRVRGERRVTRPPTATPSLGPSWRIRVAESGTVFALAVGARLLQLNHVPHKDELNHVLAARSLLENGTLEIVPDGMPYSRAWGFTYLVAGLFRLFGESLLAGRLPAVLAGATLVLLLFLWVRSEVGRTGAWFAALLLTFAPISLQLSQWVRFYTLHALLFFALCLIVYRLLSRPLPGRRTAIGLAGAAVLCLGLALHLHRLTMVGTAGLVLWTLIVAPPVIARRIPARSQRLVIAGAAALVALLAMGWLVSSEYGRTQLALASHVPVWAEGRAGDVRYYHQLFLALYGPLWTLFPLAALLAFAARPRAALLATCVFGVAFVSHSLAAWKQERYLFYALPFFFALWGFALGASLPWLKERFHEVLRHASAHRLPRAAREVVLTVLLLGVAAFAAVGTPAVSYGHKMLVVPDAAWQWGTYRGEPDWEAAGRLLRAQVDEAEVVLGSHDVAAIYGLGRLDYLLRRVSPDAAEPDDMAVGRKVPVPIVDSPASLAAVVHCHRSGIAFIEAGHWRNQGVVTSEMADALVELAAPVTIPEGWRLRAFHWNSSSFDADPDVCATLRRPTR